MSNQKNQFLFLEPPSDFVPAMEVVASFIRHEEKILFLKRNSLKPEGDTWCVPGGKRERDESLSAAMSRELYEETQLQIPASELLYVKTTFVRYPKFDFLYYLFRFDIKDFTINIKINKKEHESFQWLKLSDAVKLILTPGIEEALRIVF